MSWSFTSLLRADRLRSARRFGVREGPVPARGQRLLPLVAPNHRSHCYVLKQALRGWRCSLF